MLRTDLDTTFLAEHHLDIGIFRFYRNIVIGQVRQGTKICFEKALPVLALGMEFYSEKCPVVYLSDRRFSYSIDPTMHMEIQKLYPFLLGYGAVVYNDLNQRVARLEQRFITCPTGIFHSVEAGLDWAQDLIHSSGAQRNQR